MDTREHAAPRLVTGACIAGLAVMAYCHLRDVGGEFDEHVYYMAALFCCNIALSLALIPALLLSRRSEQRTRRAVWTTAGTLAALTIAGFIYSRTVGFPQMADHVGQWDTLGLTSVAAEVVVVTAAATASRLT
jgi:NO-binding membrane sensor protein with MHYT domain